MAVELDVGDLCSRQCRQSTPSPRFRVANRFCSKADVSCSIYAACAFIAKVSPESSDAMHSIVLTTLA